MDELETLLQQFRPRRPGPLPDVEHGRGVRPLVRVVLCGIAAAVVIMVGWRVPISVSDAPRTAVTLGALTPFVLDESRDLESILTRTSRRILPDVERPGGALHALSKE
jgi:hypothetical protein